ncbi:MAG: ABC transporter substrate-binding protein [Dehalococcoidales bacterium]|nr:ABC transporter substrate-binding protein [Dehalococcoidales bacterium]
MGRLAYLVVALTLTMGLLMGCSSGSTPAKQEQQPAQKQAQAEKPAEKAASGDYKLGVVAALTGPAAFYGEYQKRGIDLAIDEINGKGGIDGKKLVAVFEDGKGDPATSVSAMRKLISVDKVPVVIGDFTATSLAMIPVADENKVLYATSLSTHPDITKKGNWVFRNSINTVSAAQAVAEAAYKQGRRKMAIVYLDDESTMRIRDGVKAKFESLGGKVVGAEEIQKSAVDYRSSLMKIKDVNPDSVYVSSFAKQAALAFKQMDELGMKLPIYTDPIEGPDIKAAGKAAEGIIYGYATIDPVVGKDFLAKYKEKFKEDPEIFGAQYYDTVKMLAEAIKKGGYTAEGIRQATRQIKDFPGVTGKTTVLSDGDTQKEIVLKTYKDGRFVLYK